MKLTSIISNITDYKYNLIDTSYCKILMHINLAITKPITKITKISVPLK